MCSKETKINLLAQYINDINDNKINNDKLLELWVVLKTLNTGEIDEMLKKYLVLGWYVNSLI